MSDQVDPLRSLEPVIEYSNGLPAGAPRRWRFTPVWPVVLAGATTVIVAGGGMLSLVSVSSNSVRGAVRSTHLQWEQRSAQIDQAVAVRPPEQAHD